MHRSWRRNGKGCVESLEVLKNGVPEPALADNWASQVEEFFPANIAHLFLFDGEQAEAYASQDDSSALIRAAIQNLLGLDLVDRLQKDLVVYERRKRSENKANPGNSEIAEIQDSVRDSRTRIDGLMQERAALRTHRIDRCQRALRENEDAYRKMGGELYDRKEEIERKWLDAMDAVREGERALRDLAIGSLPLMLVRALLDSASRRDAREEASLRDRYLAAGLKDRDAATLRHLRREAVDQRTIKVLRKFLTDDRAERLAKGTRQIMLDLQSEVRIDLHGLLSDGLKDVSAQCECLLECQEKARTALDQAHIEMENVPETDAIAQLASEREALKQELAELQSTELAMGEDIERQKRELERHDQRLSRLIQEEAHAENARRDRERVLQHSARVRMTLDAFRRRVIERHVRRIEHLVLESYQQLLRKSALVTRLSIDPEELSLTLYGRDGNVLSSERLSAGERQLLAIALLWGLARASGRPLPTAIDTPLGRLDSGHRMRLVERYLPFASHQVVLLSTDEEIAGEYLDKLNPWIGRAYQLSYDDEAGETQILPGYLANKVPG